MVFTDALDVDIGDSTRAVDHDTLADNPEWLRDKANQEHDFDISTGDGSHKDITFATDSTFSIGASASHALNLFVDVAVIGLAGITADGTLHVATASAGSVTANASADDLVVENSTHGGITILVPDASAANLNFGTASDNVGASLQWDYDGDTNGLFTLETNKASAQLVLGSGDGVEAVRIDASGNVGIGTTSPNINGWNLAQTINAGAGASVSIELAQNDVLYAWLGVQADGTVDLTAHQSSDLTFRTNNTDRVTVQAAGNVGIGTATPGTNFGGGTADYANSAVEIDGVTRGALLITGTTDAQVLFGDSGNAADQQKAGLGYDGGVLGLYHVTDANIGRSGTNGLFLTNGGNIGIGITAPANPLHVYEDSSDTANAGVRIEQDGTGDTALHFELTGVEEFSMGLDNTDNYFHISNSDTLGTSTILKMNNSNGALSIDVGATGIVDLPVGLTSLIGTFGGATAAETDLLVENDLWIGGDDANANRSGGMNAAPSNLVINNDLATWLRDELTAPEGAEIQYGIIKAVMAHLYIAWIHPFGDGNGRTARLLELDLMLKSGVPVPACHLLSSHYNATRTEYARQLDNASRSGGDVVPFLMYAVQGLLDGLRVQLEMIWAQHLDIVWEHYIYKRMPQDTAAGKRRRDLVLDLSNAPLPVLSHDLTSISGRVAQAYGKLSPQSFARDVRWLTSNNWIIPTTDGLVANKYSMLSFTPISRSSEPSAG